MPNVLVLQRVRIAVPAILLIAGLTVGARAWNQGKKDFSVSAHKYGFKVDAGGSEIRVQQDDLVRVTFSTDDIPHSFTVEDETYRIMRRAEPGKPVTFEFRADKAGRFPFKCTLANDDRCKEMSGLLIVEARKTPR
jgi:heme/copper-type cytochrome/quinol oxidase subunit 2